ncbi:hypothetical protein OAE39_02095, partial [Akkermansiaceae bacterium]|nr:hypothetical protein [Akkermansiaceae bacterium]
DAAYNALVTERDTNLATYTASLAEKDGAITALNESITEKDSDYADLVVERDANLATYTTALAGKEEVIATLNESVTEKEGTIATLNDSITEKDAAYNALVAERDTNLATYTATLAEKDAAYAMVLAERDALFADTDADGLTDLKETELETDPNVGTLFYLDNTDFETAAANARETGQRDVILNPVSYGLVANSVYETVVNQRDARFVDTDGDGLTDVKEIELESNANIETKFYLQAAFDDAVVTSSLESRHLGRLDVINNPNNFNLTTVEAYNIVIAERNARPTQNAYDTLEADRNSRFEDTDEDGLTDVKELALGSDPTVETGFYLKGAYDSAIAVSNSEGRQAGRSDVIGTPENFNLTTIESYNAAIAERDARPTQAAYEALQAERDERFADTDKDGLTDVKEIELETDVAVETSFYLQDAYDLAIEVSKSQGRLAGRDEVTANPASFELRTEEAYAIVVAERDARFVDTDQDGLTDLKEEEIESDTAENTTFYLKPAYDSAVTGAREAGRSEVTTNPQNFSLITRDAYDSVVAQRDARFLDTDQDGLTDEKENELGVSISEETNFYLQEAFDEIGEDALDEALDRVTANPQNYGFVAVAAYNAVIEERDARFIDTDGDGLTDEKENELVTNSSEVTTFYLKSAYDSVIEESLQIGRDEVIDNPQNYALTSNAAYNNVVSERDARFADSDEDGLTDVIEAELETDPTQVTLFSILESPSNFKIALSQNTGNGGDGVVIAEVNTPDDANLFADSDLDGITDAKEEELNTNPSEQTTFYMKSAYDSAVAASRVAGRNDVTTNPQNYDLATSTAYQAVVAERDARFVDSDGDGLTDTKELELSTNASEETTFFLQDYFDTAIVNSRQSGRSEVISSPQNFDLTTASSYDAVVAQRDARFVDTDQDGLTDTKEGELSSDPATETVFYLGTAFDEAITEALQTGANNVTSNPSNYGLTNTSAYDAVVAQRDARPTLDAFNAITEERDSRFVDTDGDGLTDVREIELETDSTVETTFYLEGAYNIAIAASNSQGRQSGRLDVTETPSNFNLTTIEAYNSVIAERDARPTQASYDARVAERDARFVDTDEDGLTDVKEIELETDTATETNFYLKAAYDDAVASSNLQGRQVGRVDVTSAPGSYNLTTVEAYNLVVAERDARPTQTAYDARVAERDSRFVDTDEDGLTDVKETELETNVAVETTFYLQGTYDDAVAASSSQGRQTGRADVTGSPGSFNLTTLEAYNSVVAERDARPTQAAYNTVVEERDTRPTEEAYDAVVTERDSRFTEAQIRQMSANPTAGLNDEGNVQVDISFIHSTDLASFQPFTVTPEMMSVVDGKLRIQFPPMDQDAFFYRLGLE